MSQNMINQTDIYKPMQLNTVKEIKTRPISLNRPTSTRPYPKRFDTDTANIWFKICHPHTQDIFFCSKKKLEIAHF